MIQRTKSSQTLACTKLVEIRLQYLPLLMASFTSATVENVDRIQLGSLAIQIVVYLGPANPKGESYPWARLNQAISMVNSAPLNHLTLGAPLVDMELCLNADWRLKQKRVTLVDSPP